jgi:hypothetical protein
MTDEVDSQLPTPNSQDDELEVRLRRYRLGDPPADFRRAVMAAVNERGGSRERGSIWAPIAAAAILVAWIGAQMSTVEIEPDPLRDAEVALITEFLGGTEQARRYAEIVVPTRESDEPINVPMEVPW